MTILTIRDRPAHSIQTKQPTVNNLPLELQRMILGFLPSDDFQAVRQICPSFRDCVKDLTWSRFSKQCDLLLEKINPYLSGGDQEHLEDVLTQFRQGAQVVAGVPLAFDTKNARMVFRQELIKCLVDSTASVGVEPNSLRRVDFIELLPEEFKHVVVLTSFIREVKGIQNDPNLADWEKWNAYERLISEVFFVNDMSPIGMRDAVVLLDPEISKRLISRLFYHQIPLALELAQHFSLPDQGAIFKEVVETFVAAKTFDTAQSLLQYISDPYVKNHAFEGVITGLALDGQIDNAIRLIHTWPDDRAKDRWFQSVGKAVNFTKSNFSALNIKNVIDILTFYEATLNPLDLVSFYEGFRDKLSSRLKTSVGEAALKNKDFGLVMLVATDSQLDKDIKFSLRERVVKQILSKLPQDADEAYQTVEKFLKTTTEPILIRDEFLVKSLELGQSDLALKLLEQRRNVGYYVNGISELISGYLKKAIDHYQSAGDFKMVVRFLDYVDDDVKDSLLDKVFDKAFEQVELLQEGSFKDKWHRSLELSCPGLTLQEIESNFYLEYKLQNKFMETMRFEDMADCCEGLEKIMFKKLGRLIPVHLRTEALKTFIDGCSSEKRPQMDKQCLPDEYQGIELPLKQMILDWIGVMDRVEEAQGADPEIQEYMQSLRGEYARSGAAGVQALVASQDLVEGRQNVVTALLKVLQWDSEETETVASTSEPTGSIKRRKVGDSELKGLGIDPKALDTEEARHKLVAPRVTRGPKK